MGWRRRQNEDISLHVTIRKSQYMCIALYWWFAEQTPSWCHYLVSLTDKDFSDRAGCRLHSCLPFKAILSLAGQLLDSYWSYQEWKFINSDASQVSSEEILLQDPASTLHPTSIPCDVPPKVKHQTKHMPESFCWRASSCPIRSVGTLTAGLWSGSPSSWCTESPSACAGSAPRLTATCSAPFERKKKQKEPNSTALIFPSDTRLKCPPCSAARWPAMSPLSFFFLPQRARQHLDLCWDCFQAVRRVSWMELWVAFKRTWNRCRAALFLSFSHLLCGCNSDSAPET